MIKLLEDIKEEDLLPQCSKKCASQNFSYCIFVHGKDPTYCDLRIKKLARTNKDTNMADRGYPHLLGS